METEVTVSPSGSSPVMDADISPPCTPPAPAVDMLPSDILDLDSIFEESLNIPNLIEELGIEEDSDTTSLYEDAYFPVISQSELNKSILDSVSIFGKEHLTTPGSPNHSDAGYESY